MVEGVAGLLWWGGPEILRYGELDKFLQGGEIDCTNPTYFSFKPYGRRVA